MTQVTYDADSKFLNDILRLFPPCSRKQVRGVAEIFEWGDERRRREKRGAEGAEGSRVREGGVPSPPGRGLCPLPRNFFD